MQEDELSAEETKSVTQEPDDALEGADEGELVVTEPDGVVLEKNDRSLSEFHRWFQNGRLIVDPEWQRQYVWERKRASKLIESFLRDIPVPVIYLAKNDEGKYEVIDGLQRLTSIFDFFDNKYRLSGMELLPDLNGKHFKDLAHKLQGKLQDTTLRTFEMSPKTPKDLMFVIFERLNTGGIALNDMEIRNCLYRGPLNVLVKNLARNDDFITCANQNNLTKRMADRALIFRFLAFYERTHMKARLGLKRFLNEFLDTYRFANQDKLDEYEREFKKAMRACVTVFGKDAFRLRRDVESGSIGEWATRMNAAIFQVLSVSFTRYDIGQLTRRADAIYEEYVDLVSTDERWRDYVRRATGQYPRLEYVFDTWNQRLKLALADSAPNDSVRLFTRQLKEQMFQQNPNCAICGQRISLLLDAAMDHDVHYWRGGKTIPENAHLVHRHCNLSKAK